MGYWFVTLEGPGFERVAHAKEMGTLLSACGRTTLTWVKLWDIAFGPHVRGCCAECSSVVRMAIAARATRARTFRPDL